MVLVPSLTVMVSVPDPAMTVIWPPLSVMVSSPLLVSADDVTDCNSPSALNTAVPSSPRMVLVPSMAVMVSAPDPAMTVFWPPFNVMVSPPLLVSADDVTKCSVASA